MVELAGGRVQFAEDVIEAPIGRDPLKRKNMAISFLKDTKYAKSRKEIPAEYGLKVYAISNHLAGQMVCDEIDERHKSIDTTGGRIWGDGNPEGVRKRAAEEMKLSPGRPLKEGEILPENEVS